ncbi:MAG: ATP-binding protein [Deltaproteobacteria bacterium]|nr:ATP-binding protein [Deltaproteobacteria bacterium]
METPQNIDDLKLLIKNEVQENIHLDYKDSRAIDGNKRHEIAKDVSAFANSDGGLLIYGIREENHLPTSLDEGVDHIKYSREWLEEVITGNIVPLIDDLTIVQIPISPSHSSFVVKVPKSHRAPHQEQNSKRYYKRYNFKSQPMEDYEINDVRNRKFTVAPLVNFDILIKHGVMVYFVISNIGKVPAEDVKFVFSFDLPWRNDGNKPPILTKGIKYLPPGRIFRIYFHTAQEIFSKDNIPREFDVSVTYLHPEVNQRLIDIFHVDFDDYLNTDASSTELQQHGEKIEGSINKLISEVKDLNKHMKYISNVAGPTGLDFSVTTLRDLKSIFTGGDSFSKIDPISCDYTVFKEVLQIDTDLSFRLSQHFWQNKSIDGIEKIEGISEEIIAKFRKYFRTEKG